MGIFDRLSQVIKGKAVNAVADIENRNPEAVYEAAVPERERKYGELKKAAADLAHMRDRRKDELSRARRELDGLAPGLSAAVESGQDEAALTLLERRESLERQVEELSAEVASLEAQVTETTAGLRTFKEEVARLKRERTEMLARNQTAEARISMKETLDGLSTDADVRGLSGVREHIRALADDAGLDDARVSDANVAKSRAQAQLAALKRQLRGEAPAEPAPSSGDAEPPAADEAAPPEDEAPKRTL